MTNWLAFADPVRALLLALTHVTNGSVGGAILLLSFIVRGVMFPLALRLAQHAIDMEGRLAAAKPELDRVRAQWVKDPMRQLTETQRIHAAHGIRPMSGVGLLNLAIQLPLGAAIFRAVTHGAARAGRFLWIGDLALPDALLAGLAATSAALVAALPTGSTNGAPTRVLVAVSAAIALAVTWHMASGVGLYWVGTNLASAAQSVVIRRVLRDRARR